MRKAEERRATRGEDALTVRFAVAAIALAATRAIGGVALAAGIVPLAAGAAIVPGGPASMIVIVAAAGADEEPAVGIGAPAIRAAPRQAEPGSVVPPSSDPIEEVLVRVGGVEIRALCNAERPEVVLLHGGEASAETWLPVLAALDGSVPACAYDRRGSGESDAAPERRGWYELMDELRRIHDALGASAPYVLVGHDLGGLYARLYAADRPGDVAGLVLVEPVHEDMPRRVRPGMPDDEWDAWMRSRRAPNDDGLVETVLAERARRSRLPSVPVTVLTATRRRDGDGWDARFVNEAARQVHASIVRGVSFARHVPAASGPVIQRDAPDLLAREIARIVRVVTSQR